LLRCCVVVAGTKIKILTDRFCLLKHKLFASTSNTGDKLGYTTMPT
jgi:hypothetical protein